VKKKLPQLNNQKLKLDSNTLNRLENRDIYSGSEEIHFSNRHPIFKALMKLEFEDVIRNYQKRFSSK
jgi:hypothetical protein